MRTIIVDDETKLREVLAIKLKKICPEVTIIGQANNITEAKDLIEQLEPDLVFLDIEMPGGSGLDLLESLTQINFEIIFVTGYNEYAVPAFKVSAVDYLLKPINSSELENAVKKAGFRVKQKLMKTKYETLKHNINSIGDQSTKVAIPNNESYDFIKVRDIIRCEGWNKYTKIHILGGDVITSSYSIGTFIDMLEDYGFYTSHKSHIVNKHHIVRYHKEGIIVMNDESQVPVARRRKESFVSEVMANNVIRQ